MNVLDFLPDGTSTIKALNVRQKVCSLILPTHAGKYLIVASLPQETVKGLR